MLEGTQLNNSCKICLIVDSAYKWAVYKPRCVPKIPGMAETNHVQ